MAELAGGDSIPECRPVHVLHVFGSMDRGGAELRTVDVARCLDPTRFRCDFLTLSGRRGTLAPAIEVLGGEVIPCPLGPGFLVRFASVLRRRRIDVIHSHVHLATGFLLACARVGGIRRRIAHFRSTADERGRGFGRRAYRGLMRRAIDMAATDIVGVSAGVLAAVWSAGWRTERRCRVIYNGVDASRYDLPSAPLDVRTELGLPSDALLVVQAGRVGPPKNPGRSLEVVARLPAECPAQILFVGRSEAREVERLQARAGELGLAGRVRFLGERDDVPRLLCAANASILPSEREGLPGAVLESVACGTPVLATSLPGVREIAQALPGVRMLDLSDRVEIWAAELSRLLSKCVTPEDRRGARERLEASPFSLASATEGHVRLWSGAVP